MKAVWAFVRIAFRSASYLALAVLVVALGALAIMVSLGVCSRIDTGAVICTNPAVRQAANLAFSVVLVSMFAGFPALLAMAGFAYVLRDIQQLLRRRRPT